MKPAREQVAHKVNVDAWHLYRKAWVFSQVEILVEVQIEGRVVNQIDADVRERVRSKL